MAIPLNDHGTTVMAEAFNKAINLTGTNKTANNNNSEKMKDYLNTQFIPKLASEIAKATKMNSSLQGNSTPINAFS